MKPSALARSIAIFTLMGMLSVLLHELGHATTALALGGHPVILFPGRVTSRLHDSNGVLVAMAGPVFSLVLAGIGALVVRRMRGGVTARLSAIWFTFHAFLGAVGYLILTPFGRSNDLGGVAEHYDLPSIVRWGMLGLGVFAMSKVSGVLLTALAELAPSADLLASPRARSSFALQVAVVPWLAYVACSLLSNLPDLHLAGSIFTLCIGIPLLSMSFDARKREDLVARASPTAWPERMPWMWIVAIVAFILVNRFVLLEGLTLGS